MSLLEVIFLALILATDAFVVSFSYGLCNIKQFKKTAMMLALGTGLFQFLMPLIGAFLTNLVFDFINIYAKYIAGIIFITLGVKMLFDAKSDKTNYCENNEANVVTLKTVFLISVATSIDALASGSSLFLLKANIFESAIIIGVITFVLSFIGFYAGKFFKKNAPDIVCKTAGAFLILLGLKSIFL